MLNIEKYKEEILVSLETRDIYCTIYKILENLDLHFAEDDTHYDRCVSMIEWLCTEYEEPVLTDEEREYLSNVIKPFKKEGIEIWVYKRYDAGLEYLSVRIKRENDFETELGFPPFKKGAMYKGMQENAPYSLEGLGLLEKEKSHDC